MYWRGEIWDRLSERSLMQNTVYGMPPFAHKSKKYISGMYLHKKSLKDIQTPSNSDH